MIKLGTHEIKGIRVGSVAIGKVMRGAEEIPVAAVPWLLASGLWNDGGAWRDESAWADAA